MPDDVDLRAAINAVSDVVQNRPRPLREFDQIYMKAGDMVMQSEFVARWSDGKRLAFIGDGDSISVCVAYLQLRNILGYGPARITVFDFDERIVKAVKRFADRERIENLDAELYNCIDPMRTDYKYDLFYTNPPWGASNDGASVNLFAQRGMEAIGFEGEGCIVIADDEELDWPKLVLAGVQRFAAENAFYVSRMMPRLHSYHLDDAPSLKSCNLLIRSQPGDQTANSRSIAVDATALDHFYGQDQPPRVRYVRERQRVDYGKAPSEEYSFELLDEREEP